MRIYFLHTTFWSGIMFGALLFPFHTFGASYIASPETIEHTLMARDIVEEKITIDNTGSVPITVYPSVNNISLKNGGGIEEFITPAADDRTASLSSWLEIKRLGIDIPPQTSKTFDLTIRINPEPKPGTYHAFIGFGTGRNRDEAEAQVKNGIAPGVVVTVTIKEKKNEVLKLAGFFVERFVTKNDNQAAVYRFKNPGDQPLTPKGEIIVYDGTGAEVSAITVNEENVTIPPGGEHVFTAAMPTEGLFGKYKAFLTIEYGSEQKANVQDTSFFYVLPLKKILIIFGIVMLGAVIFAWILHKKYFDDEVDDSEYLSFHIRENQSEPKEHDLDLKKK